MNDEWLTEAARQLGIALDPAWVPQVRANYEIMQRLAAQFPPVPDETEPAPVFRA